MKIPTKESLRNEALIQGFFFVPMIICYAIVLFSNDADFAYLGIAFFLQTILVIAQIISSIIRILKHGSKLRKIYLYWGFVYIFSSLILAYLTEKIELGPEIQNLLWIISVMIIPTLFTGYYTMLTYFQGKGRFLKYDLPNFVPLNIIEHPDKVVDEIMQRHRKRILK